MPTGSRRQVTLQAWWENGTWVASRSFIRSSAATSSAAFPAAGTAISPQSRTLSPSRKIECNFKPSGPISYLTDDFSTEAVEFIQRHSAQPFFLSWPLRLQAAGEFAHPVTALDLTPTFLAAAGVAVPETDRLNGIDLLPHLLGEQAGPPHGSLLWCFTIYAAIRA